MPHALRRREPAVSTGLAAGAVAAGAAAAVWLSQAEDVSLLTVAAGAAFLLAFGLLAVAHPVAAVAVVIGLLAVVRTEPAPVDAALAVLIVVSLVLRRPEIHLPAFVAVPLALLAALTLISVTNAVHTSVAVEFGLVTLYLIGVAVWLTWPLAHERVAQLAFAAYAVVAALSGLAGVAALFLPLPGRNLLLFDDQRAQGLFQDPNVYGPFLVVAAVVLLEELSLRRLFPWPRWAVALLLVATLLGVVVSFSRAAWVNLAVAVSTMVVMYALRRGGMRWAVRSAAVLVVIGLAGLGLLHVSGSLGFLEERAQLQAYDTERFSAQASAFAQATRHVLGSGPGQSDLALPVDPHSAYARSAYEQGLLGLTLVIVVFGATIWCAAVLARRAWTVHGIGTAALLGAWVGIVVNSVFIDTLHWRHLWVVAALVWTGYALLQRGQARSADTSRASTM